MNIVDIQNFAVDHDVQMDLRFGDFSSQIKLDMYRGPIGCVSIVSVIDIESSIVPVLHKILCNMYMEIYMTLRTKEASDNILKKYGG